MNTIDYCSIVIIIISAITSFFRGFIQEVASITVWGIGIYILFKYYSIFCFSQVYIHNKIIRYVINFLIFMFFLLVIKFILHYFVMIFIKKFHLFLVNKILGIFFGVARGIFLICIILFFLEFSTNFVHSQSFKTSLLIPYYNYFIKLFLKLFIRKILM
ncbi:MAG: CvpA family protein [Buchnera aphidicola (Schlechtendalia peitan)]